LKRKSGGGCRGEDPRRICDENSLSLGRSIVVYNGCALVMRGGGAPGVESFRKRKSVLLEIRDFR
jgi:hypothetical protein